MKVLMTLSTLLFLLSGFVQLNTIQKGKNLNMSEDGILGDSIIVWSADSKLNWSDFQAEPDLNDEYLARSWVQIGLTSKQYEDKVVIQVPTYFYKSRSWSKKKSSTNLLAHEQLHFDITELMARHIRQEFSEYKLTDVKSGFKELKSIYHKYYSTELDKYSRAYDAETNHGIIREEQEKWESKIAQELKSMEDYTSSEVIIEIIKN
ncbi:MAG: DUF922 domain-containing protein [Crocinitomicaceae bacterium]|nr:DUF922 domain-containing protein [Crocinitomicaceae bacterium]